MKAKTFYRAMDIDRAIDEETRTVQLAFSSEAPVERYFGHEVLDHAPESVDLSRMTNKAAVLVDHDPTDPVGVVEQVEVGSDRVGRAIVRFGKSKRATEIFDDIVDGIRSGISVGYRIHEMETEGEVDDKGLSTYRATNWQPYEVSVVSVPADIAVGVGRSEDDEEYEITIRGGQMEKQEKIEVVEPDMVAIRKDAIKDERKRQGEIRAIAERHGALSELAEDYIKDGKSVEEFRTVALDKIDTTPVQVSADIGMTEKETRSYSLHRLISALANPTDAKAQKEAGFEFEASRAVESRLGKHARGAFIPDEVQKRDLTLAGDGSNLRPDNLDTANFIEFLDNNMVTVGAGATVMRDLVGTMAIPRRDAAITASWVAEAGSAEVTPSYDQVTMTAKTVTAYTDITRQLLNQSSMNVENLIKTELMGSVALALDLAALAGTGASNQPTGICATSGVNAEVLNAADTPNWADVVNMEKAVMEDNALMGNLSYIAHPTIAGNMKATAKDAGSGLMLLENGSANGYNVHVTNQAIYTTVKRVIFGNFSDLLIGLWSGLDVMVDPYTLSSAGGIRVVCLQDADIAVRHPQSFCVSSNS